MRAAFFGTPAAAVPALAAFADVADVQLIVTRPDAARGRSSRPEPPAVKLAAQEWGFRVAQPQDQSTLPAFLRECDLDIAVVVAYGRILRPEVLASTRVGFVNLHFSLLPRWRGAAPVERTILTGDTDTGVTLMVLDDGIDTGPVIAVAETAVGPDETGGSLTARLAHLGADLLVATLPDYLAGNREPAPQIDAAATHAAPLTTAEARLDPGDDAETILRKVRAFNPRPGAWLSMGGERLKVWVASEIDIVVAQSGIVGADGLPVLGVAGGSIALEVVQAAGKRAVSGTAWLRGRRDPEIVVDRF